MKYKLAHSELELMDFFWASNKEKCKRDILDYFGNQGKSGSAISFLLSKLTKGRTKLFLYASNFQIRV